MEKFRIHKVFTQSGKSLAVVIPAEFVKTLDLMDGSYVRITLLDKRLVIDKIGEDEATIKEVGVKA